MDWKPEYELDKGPMDATHREFAEAVTALATVDKPDALACMDSLIEHTVEHFEQENRWMEECGFPPIHCHTEEHERVLQSLRGMRATVQADPGVARILARELEAWFAQHAATMDDALAYFMRQVKYVPTPGSGK